MSVLVEGTFQGDAPSQRALARINVRRIRPEKRPVTGRNTGCLRQPPHNSPSPMQSTHGVREANLRDMTAASGAFSPLHTVMSSTDPYVALMSTTFRKRSRRFRRS